MRYHEFVIFFNLAIAMFLITLSVITRDSDYWIVGMLVNAINLIYIGIMQRFDDLVKAI